jgi:hypothetical protein
MYRPVTECESSCSACRTTEPRQGSRLTEPLPNVLLIYENRRWAYEFRRPEVWHERPLEVEGGQGVLFSPDPVDMTTSLSVEVRELGTVVTPDDLPDLEAAFLAGLRAVPGFEIESHDAFANEFAIGVDAVHTFVENGTRRKRWLKLLYKRSVQARVIAQAATVAEYDRLRPLFAPCMTTFMLGGRVAKAGEENG